MLQNLKHFSNIKLFALSMLQTKLCLCKHLESKRHAIQPFGAQVLRPNIQSTNGCVQSSSVQITCFQISRVQMSGIQTVSIHMTGVQRSCVQSSCFQVSRVQTFCVRSIRSSNYLDSSVSHRNDGVQRTRSKRCRPKIMYRYAY